MRYVVHGRSRFTHAELELHIDAQSNKEAQRKAMGLGLESVAAQPANGNGNGKSTPPDERNGAAGRDLPDAEDRHGRDR